MAGGIPRDPQDNDRDWSAREIARRNRESIGKPLSPVMKTAATACELAHGRAAEEDREKSRPPWPSSCQRRLASMLNPSIPP